MILSFSQIPNGYTVMDYPDEVCFKLEDNRIEFDMNTMSIVRPMPLPKVTPEQAVEMLKNGF